MDTMVKALDSFLNKKIKSSAVQVVEEDGLPSVAAQDDVI